MWLRHSKFKEVVKDAWTSPCSGIPISLRLKDCMAKLTQWSGKEFGDVKMRITILKERIQYLRERLRSEEIATEEVQLSNELDEWLKREELFWRQRSRAECLKNGDRNTSYFHAKATQRRKRNHIDRLKNHSGVTYESEPDIISIITNYFMNIFYSQASLHGGR
ncbi:hypothetical protein QQ045_030989 [Rhodiola kirilowii]